MKDEETAKIKFKDTLPKKVSAPVNENDVIGQREYFLDGKSIGTVNLLSEKAYKLDPITFIVNKMIAFVTSPWLYVTIAGIIIILILAERRRRRIIRKKRREARRKRTAELTESIFR